MGKQADLDGLGGKSSLHLRQRKVPVEPRPAAGHCRHVVAPDNVELVEADGEVEGKVLARIQRQLAGPAHLAARAIDSAKLGERHPLLRYVCRSEEHTSELQSLMRISSAVFCLKKKRKKI